MVYQNGIFHDPWGWGSCSKVWPYKLYSEIHYFFKNFLLYSQAQIRQTEGNDAQGRVYENCKFHDPQDRGSCARVWPYKSYSENGLFL